MYLQRISMVTAGARPDLSYCLAVSFLLSGTDIMKWQVSVLSRQAILPLTSMSPSTRSINPLPTESGQSLHLPGVTQEQEIYCKVHVHVQYIPSLCRACAVCICGAGAATQPLEAEETRARVLLLLLSCPRIIDMCCLFTFHCSFAFSSASLSVLERIRLATLSEVQIRG